MWTYTTDSMDFVTASTGLISPYWMGLPIRYIHDDLITSFEVALQTIRKVKARVIEFWDSLFPDWRDFKQDDLKIESLKRHNILFGSTRSYCKLCVLSPTGSQL